MKTSPHTAIIDGITLRVRNGQTILEGARKAGIYIPTLCYLDNLKSYGGCRLCIVHIKGRKGFSTACTTPLEAGMEIKTATPEIQALRREILELTLSEHPYTCLVCKDKKDCTEFMHTSRKVSTITGCNFCTSNGDCELQELTEALDLKDVKFPISYRGIPPERNNPFYDLDYNLCVLCGRCVRICNEERNSNVLAFVERGNQSVVGTAFGESQLDAGCEFCGACVDVCPTGSISEKMGKWAGHPDKSTETVCTLCSVGCTINVNTRGSRVTNVGPKPGMRTNPPQICVRAKFLLPDIVHHPNRLQAPLIRKKNKWQEVDWAEAIDYTANHLAKFRGNQFGIICSGQDTLEDNYILQKFSRKVMHSNNIDLIGSYDNRKLAMEMNALKLLNESADINEILKADTVFMVGTNASVSHPLVENRVRKAWTEGKTIVYANPVTTRTSLFSTRDIRYKPGESCHFLFSLAHALAGKAPEDAGYKKALGSCGIAAAEMDEIFSILSRSQKLIIIAGDEVLRRESGEMALRALSNIQLLKNQTRKCGSIFLGYEGYPFASIRAGIHPDFLPGFASITDPAAIQRWNTAWETSLSKVKGLSYKEMLNGSPEKELKALMVAGDLPAHKRFAKLDFCLQINMFKTSFSEFADVVFPATSFLENEGHILSLQGKTGRLKKVLTPPGKSKSISGIISELSATMKVSGFANEKPSEIWKEILKMNILPEEKQVSGSGILFPLKHFTGKTEDDSTVKPGMVQNHFHYRGNDLAELVPELKEIISKLSLQEKI